MDELERILLNTLAREKLLPDGARVTAAVSGGADSVAMAHLLKTLAPARGWELDILHVNHRARSGSDGDQEFVERLASELSLPFRAVALEPGGSAGEREWSAARQCIYEACPRLVAVAHSRDDRAETLLLRLCEGAGLRGLGGMDYRGRGPVRRPMLDMGREGIRSWLRSRDIQWREDPTNNDAGMARNRMRLQVLPVLEDAFPGSVEGICRSSAVLSGWRDLQDALGELLPELSIKRREFLELPDAVASLALWQMAGRPRTGFQELAKVLKWLQGGGNGEHLLPGGRRLTADREGIKVTERGPGRY